jgi:hypothetical protein
LIIDLDITSLWPSVKVENVGPEPEFLVRKTL